MKEEIYGFLDYILLERKYSDYTEVNYEIDLFKYNEYLKAQKKNYLKVKYIDISEYIIFLKKSNYKSTTINRNISTLRSFYKYLEVNNRISSNPFNLIKGVKKEKKLPNYFKYQEFETMLNTLNEDSTLNVRNRLILELLLATGVRVGELVNIKLSDINIKEREIKVLGKGKKSRIVYFGSYAQKALNSYLNDSRPKLLNNKSSEYLLLNNLGGNLTDRGVRLIIDNIFKASAITSKVSPHTFRHTFATIMLNEGCNIKSVQELLGHVSLDTTSIYTHLTNEEIRRVYLKSHPRARDNVK